MAADGFRQTGLLVSPRSAWARAGSALGDAPLEALAVGAVNLSFALELYLKALLVYSGIAPLRSHRLRELFDGLPPHLQQRLHELYGDASRGDRKARMPTRSAASSYLRIPKQWRRCRIGRTSPTLCSAHCLTPIRMLSFSGATRRLR